MSIKKEKRSDIICIAILTLLPLITSVVWKLFNMSDGSLLTSEWNDELFYFKQVEAIIDHGYPLGYYGFNESHALSFSFAAWSPVLVWPWVILGFIFGWTRTTVMIFNVFIYMAAMFLFGLFVKPSVKQTAGICVWFLAFFLNVRYIFSCMPEVICFAHLIVFWALMLGYFRVRSEDASKGKGYIIAAIALSMLMTFMRPYLILFLVFPLLVLFVNAKGKKKKLIVVGISLVIMGITAFIYYLLNHYLSAEYLMPFFYTDFITTFFTKGFGAGVHNLFGTLYYKGKDFIQYMKDAFYIDRAAGIFFWWFLFMMLLQLIESVLEGRSFRKEKQSEAAEKNGASKKIRFTGTGAFYSRIYMLFADFAFLVALLLMYKLTEGSKHLLTFICVGVLLMIMESKKGLIFGSLMCVCVIYFGAFHCVGNDYDFGIPEFTDESEARIAYWQQAFSEGIELDTGNVPSYDNAIIWEFNDVVGDETITTDWQMLYALPSGTGISCCYEYTADHFDEIRCRYISAPSGGRIEELCTEAGYRLIGRDERFCVYARY